MPLPDLQKAAELGRALRRVRDSIIKQDPTGRTKRIWFQGPEPYLDALFEVCDGTLGWFQVTLRGRSLTFDPVRGCIVTGHTNELAVDEPLAPASKVVCADAGQERRRAPEQAARAVLKVEQNSRKIKESTQHVSPLS